MKESIKRLAADGSVVVEVQNEPWCLGFGAECINPDKPEEKRIYRKVFRKKKIYLPGEYETAMAEVIESGQLCFVR